jgi:peroxiredoxin family protein
MDKVLAAFVIANGAKAMGGDVTMFFTFWGLNALRKPDGRAARTKPFMDAMFGWMMPKGINKLPISNMNFGGIGPKLLRHQMGSKGLPNLPGLMKSANEQKIRIVACTMSMDAMGIGREELLDEIELGGVADYLAASQKSGTNLFI